MIVKTDPEARFRIRLATWHATDGRGDRDYWYNMLILHFRRSRVLVRRQSRQQQLFPDIYGPDGIGQLSGTESFSEPDSQEVDGASEAERC